MTDLAKRFGPQPPAPGSDFYLCGCCEHYHPVTWDGDCRDDNNRYTTDQLDEKFGRDWKDVTDA